MGGSWKIGTFWGIPLKVHWTFSLLLIYILVVGRMEGMSGDVLIWFVVLFLALFVCVILHEYGHALAARAYGVRTADIIILPVGGLARLERLPEKPIQELVVAIAGPAVNLWLMALGLGWLWLSGDPSGILPDLGRQAHPSSDNILPQLVMINGALFLFNLIPAFPMDGGRILRAFLAMMMPKLQATVWATRLGMLVSLGFVVVGFVSGNLILALVGLVVMFLARAEKNAAELVEGLRHNKAIDIADRNFVVFNDWDKLQTIREKLSGRKVNVILSRDVFGSLTGYVPADHIRSESSSGTDALHSFTQALCPAVTWQMDVIQLIHIFRNANCDYMPVKNMEGAIVGVISKAQIAPLERLLPQVPDYEQEVRK